jgi:4-alpha-glucanotransferase
VSKTEKPGTFAAGEKFIDWLVKSKQLAWQMLPLHETQLQKGSKSKHVPSPYKGYGIGLDPSYLKNDAPIPADGEINKFVKENKYWIHGYTLFCALRDHFGTDNWSKWPREIRKRENKALVKWQNKLAPAISKHVRVQVQLHLAYQVLQEKAQDNNILLIGDMPFYLCLNGPLVWEYQNLFEIEQSGVPLRVSGAGVVSLGNNSHFGRQIWGHPLYKWQRPDMFLGIYKLFKVRLKYLKGLYKLARFDYANGLFIYGVINLSNRNLDSYEEGPGARFLEKIIKYSRRQHLALYAEDTGIQLADLRSCLRSHHLPGIKIFRFAYNEKRKEFHDQYLKIYRYPVSTVAYSTTHDTETLLGYLEILSNIEIIALAKKLHYNKSLNLKIFASWIRDKIINSKAKIVLIPLQDWLLTTERINIPGTEKEINDTNWQYQMSVAIENLPIEVYLS